ncbi:MAG TPA: hypothetical protein VGG51_13815 [Candidatus Cybelea sp.]|jgi:hypothetical protein
MAQTYKPGEIVPKTSKVQCVEHDYIEDHVEAGTRFAPCHHFNEKGSAKGCAWQYV